MRARELYDGSDGELTKRYYQLLEKAGPIGIVAVNLFRAQKCSARAKKYRGGIRGVGSYRSMAYHRKNWSMKNLVRVLGEHGDELGVRWGWKIDPKQEFHCWVLYVDLPTRQTSFHCESRLEGPDYPEDWDGIHASADRIIALCDQVFETLQVA